MPTTSYPWSCSISAVTVLSIPPLIATKTFPFRLIFKNLPRGKCTPKSPILPTPGGGKNQENLSSAPVLNGVNCQSTLKITIMIKLQVIGNLGKDCVTN